MLRVMMGLLMVGTLGLTPALASEKGAHLLVQLVMDGAEFRIVHSQRVEIPLPEKWKDAGRPHPWRLSLLGTKGAVLHQVGLADPTELRGEFHHPDGSGRIQAVHTKHKGPVHFVVRLPLVEASRLRFEALEPSARRQPKPPAEAWQTLGSVSLPKAGGGR
jgi:hypothetical protein